MKFQYNDGGRSAAGWKGNAGDCVTRAVAIAADLPYNDVYEAFSNGCQNQRRGKRDGKRSSARDGVTVQRKWFKEYMAKLGFFWVPTMFIGSGCTVHLKDGELPMGRLVVNVSKHFVAVIDGVMNDTIDGSRNGTRCVYGYYIKNRKEV